MLRYFYLFIFIAPFIATGQTSLYNCGVQWQNSMNWEQVKQKAREENKYIFIDCMTTWCLPCKKMDVEVFSKDSVYLLLNSKFISLRYQMDSTSYDNVDTKANYGIAREMRQRYNITSFPTFLFFSPTGEIVHKEVGARKASSFINNILHQVTDPNKQFYTLLTRFGSKHLKKHEIISLISIAEKVGEKNIAEKVAYEYLHFYADSLGYIDLANKDDVDLINKFSRVITTQDGLFKKIYSQGSTMDSIMGIKDYSKNIIDAIIYKDEFEPLLVNAKKINSAPRWNKLFNKIVNKYNRSTAYTNLLRAKLNWFEYKKDWKSYSKYLVEQIEDKFDNTKYEGITGTLYLNNNAWEVFQHSFKKKQLLSAVKWVDYILTNIDSADFQTIDTKANLLYKLGYKAEAIKWEEKALEIVIRENRHEQYRNEYTDVLNKIRCNIPTWPKKASK